MKKCVCCFVVSLVLVLFFSHSNTEANEAEVVKKMAAQGVPMAQYMLGMMYEHGDGVTRDLREAKKWYELSADGGVTMAREKLSLLDAQSGGGYSFDIDNINWDALSRIDFEALGKPLTIPKSRSLYTVSSTVKSPVNDALITGITAILMSVLFDRGHHHPVIPFCRFAK